MTNPLTKEELVAALKDAIAPASIAIAPAPVTAPTIEQSLSPQTRVTLQMAVGFAVTLFFIGIVYAQVLENKANLVDRKSFMSSATQSFSDLALTDQGTLALIKANTAEIENLKNDNIDVEAQAERNLEDIRELDKTIQLHIQVMEPQ